MGWRGREGGREGGSVLISRLMVLSPQVVTVSVMSLLAMHLIGAQVPGSSG